MKPLFFLSIFFASFSIKAQTNDTAIISTPASEAQFIDAAITGISAVPVQPFRAKFTDTTNTTHLGVRIISDDLKSECTLYWCFLDAYGHETMNGNATICCQDYNNWNGNNQFPFIFIANKFGLTFLIE